MTFASFREELKARNVRKTMAIYVGAALTTIGVIKLFMETYNLPTAVMPIIVTVLTCGIGSAFVFAWFHGKEGAQTFSKEELAFHSLIGVLALVISFRVSGGKHEPKRADNAKTIAVLPFKNLSTNKEDEYFSDGIMEDILTQLSKVGELSVISRTSVMKYKETTKTIREISQELGAGTILEGSVRHDKNRVRITGQLINAKTDEHLWAETYDREMNNVFEIQSEVARQIALALKAKLTPQEIKLITEAPTNNLDAYGLYLQGRTLYYRYRKADNDKAIEYFTHALALDSNYALAYAGLGDAYCQRVQKFDSGREWIDSAIVVSQKALALNPSLPEGHKALGLAFDAKGWRDRAREQYSLAVQLNPNYSDVLGNLGMLHQSMGNLDQSLKLLKRAVTLAPDRIYLHVNVALVYQILGMDSAAFAWFTRAITLDPNQLYVYGLRGWLHLTRGELLQAKALRDTVLAHTSDSRAVLDYLAEVETFSGNHRKAAAYYDTLYASGMSEAGYQLAFALQQIGETRRATEILRADLNQLSLEIEQRPNGFQYLRMTYLTSLLGNNQEANQWLTKAIEAGLRDYRWLQADPRLKQLRASAEYQATIAKLKTDVDSMREGIIGEGLVF